MQVLPGTPNSSTRTEKPGVLQKQTVRAAADSRYWNWVVTFACLQFLFPKVDFLFQTISTVSPLSQLHRGVPARRRQQPQLRGHGPAQVLRYLPGRLQRVLRSWRGHWSHDSSHILSPVYHGGWGALTLQLHRERALPGLNLNSPWSSRDQVYQAERFPPAGDGPVLPHVLEHLPVS